MATLAGCRVLERVADDAVDAEAGEHRRLDAELSAVAGVHPAARTAVLAFCILSHEHHIHGLRSDVREWTTHAGQQPNGP